MRFKKLRSAGWSALVAVVVLASAGAVAQESITTTPSASDGDAAARAHFARGRAAYERGNFAVALDAFQAAYTNSPHPKLLYNVGLAAQKVGHVAEAISAFEGYLAWGEGDRQEEVCGRLAALRDLADRDATFAAPVPAPVEAAAALAEQPLEQPAPVAPASSERSPRKWWPWVAAAGVVAALTAAIAVPLARRDDPGPETVMPNTGLRIEALWSSR